MPAPPTVFVVDDDSAVRDSLSALLSSQGLPAECFPSAGAYLDSVSETRVGCLLLDLRMPGMTGIELLQRLANDGASRPTVVITGCADISAVVQAMKLGAIDLLQKPCHPGKLVELVRTSLESDIRNRSRQQQHENDLKRIEALSGSDQLLLSGIVRGLTNQQIALELDISLRTVQFRRKHLFASLGIKKKSELFEVVHSAGWLPKTGGESHLTDIYSRGSSPPGK